MEHWEFLLQKEGDRSWLPLDSPDVEILEGRYRIVARSSNINATIETRIVHIATEAVPAKRRVQKRSCHTNQDGLMVVIPFTRLEPGLWELQCSPTDLLTDLMTGAQPHAVTLQVVAQELEEDWDPDWTSPAAAPIADTILHSSDSSTAPAVDTANVKNTFMPNTAPAEESLAEIPSAATGSLQSLGADTTLPAAIDRQVPLPPEVAEILGASMDRLFQIAEQLSEQLVDEVLQDFDLTAIADAPSSIDRTNSVEAANATEAVESSDRATAPTAPTASINHVASSHQPSNASLPIHYTLAAGEAFELTLDQAAFVAARGEEITVSAQIAIVPCAAAPRLTDTTQGRPSYEPGVVPTVTDPWDSEASLNFAGATAQELQLCLRDPQSLQVLVSKRQPLPSSDSPFSFTFAFSLPDTFSTHLALGELLLCGSLPGTESLIALVTQSFSITVDPNALVGELTKLHEALTTEVDDEERIDLPLELSSRLKEQASPPLDLSFLNLAVVEPQDERSPRFPSLAGQPLPPQLYRPNPEQANARSLNLPAFKLINHLDQSIAVEAETTLTAPEPDTIATTSVNETDVTSVSDSALAPSGTLANAITPEVPENLDSITDSTPAELTDAVGVDPACTNDIDKTLDLPSPTHMAFQSLKLQDRFLTRLASLATDTELSALLKANLAPGTMSPKTTAVPSAAEVQSLAEEKSLAEEIVVDDEPSLNERSHSNPQTIQEQPNPLLLPADDPVPTPVLEVVTGELVSGKLINIRAKLPNVLPRIYVKLWIIDRQTRSLLDGPRWLVDFLPNGLGDLEALTPLTVPFGSVEIRLEAVAVEMHTQRESHKVTVDRVVVPPNLPSVSLDDFNE